MTITIVGFSQTQKVPGFYGETVYGAGALTAGDIPLTLLLVGTKLSTGSATADQDVDDIFSSDDADTLYGAGSQLSRMAYAALQVDGVKIKGAPVAEAGGAVAATATITIDGTWTATGEWRYRIDGVEITGAVATTDTLTVVGAAIVAAITGNPQLPVTAAHAAGAGTSRVITITRKSKGATGNQGILFQDKSKLPSGLTSVLAGGSAVTGDGIHFGSGAGTENVSTLLGILAAGRYDRIAFAQNDASNTVRWATFLNSQAGVLTGILEHAITARNDSFSAASSYSTTNSNAQRIQILWALNEETHPSELAAVMGALRTATEQTDPSSAYDGVALPGVAPQSQRADWASFSVQSAALDNGLTPLLTTEDGQVVVVRSITSKSLTNAIPDYRTLDTYQAVVPDFVRLGLDLYWTTVFKVSNPKVGPDPATEEREPVTGIATPSLWNSEVYNLMKGWEGLLYVTDVDANLPISEYDPVAKRIMSIVPVVPSRTQHMIGVSVRQIG